jgi:hypothetical protein
VLSRWKSSDGSLSHEEVDEKGITTKADGTEVHSQMGNSSNHYMPSVGMNLARCVYVSKLLESEA